MKPARHPIMQPVQRAPKLSGTPISTLERVYPRMQIIGDLTNRRHNWDYGNVKMTSALPAETLDGGVQMQRAEIEKGFNPAIVQSASSAHVGPAAGLKTWPGCIYELGLIAHVDFSCTDN